MLHKSRHENPMANLGTNWDMPCDIINVKICTSHQHPLNTLWTLYNFPSQFPDAKIILYGRTTNRNSRHEWQFESTPSGCDFFQNQRWHYHCTHNIIVHLHKKKSTIPQWKQQQCLKRQHKINSQQLCSNRSSRPQSNINNKPYCKLETNHNPQPESLSFKTRQNMRGLSHRKQETHHLQGYRKGCSTFLPGIYFTNISWIWEVPINK